MSDEVFERLVREVVDLRKQRDDLHRANNEEVERRRAAERNTASAMVREFSQAFGVPMAEKLGLPEPQLCLSESYRYDYVEILRALKTCPKPANGSIRQLRVSLLCEEMAEYLQAELEDDIQGIADGLTDVHYIKEGTMLAYGIPSDPCMAEVHRSNMAKLGPDGKPIMRADGKIAKPDGWQAPDIAGILERAK